MGTPRRLNRRSSSRTHTQRPAWEAHMPERTRSALHEHLAALPLIAPSLRGEIAFSSSDILGYARGGVGGRVVPGDRTTAPAMARPSLTSSRKTKSPSRKAATRLITSYGPDDGDCLGHGR